MISGLFLVFNVMLFKLINQQQIHIDLLPNFPVFPSRSAIGI